MHALSALVIHPDSRFRTAVGRLTRAGPLPIFVVSARRMTPHPPVLRRASDQALLAKAETRWVYVDAKTGRPIQIHPEIKNAFELVPVDHEPRIAVDLSQRPFTVVSDGKTHLDQFERIGVIERIYAQKMNQIVRQAIKVKI